MATYQQILAKLLLSGKKGDPTKLVAAYLGDGGIADAPPVEIDPSADTVPDSPPPMPPVNISSLPPDVQAYMQSQAYQDAQNAPPPGMGTAQPNPVLNSVGQAAKNLFVDQSAPNPFAGSNDASGPPIGQNPDGSYIYGAAPAPTDTDDTPPPAANAPPPTNAIPMSGAPQAPTAAPAPQKTGGGGTPAVSVQPEVASINAQAAELGKQGDSEAANQGAAADAIAAQQKQADAYQARVEAEENHLSNWRQELIQNSLAKVDPNHFWKNKNTGQRILAGLSMMTANLPLIGFPNMRTGDSPVSKAIDNDIQNQKDELERNKNAANQVGEQYTMARQQGLDHIDAMKVAVANTKEIAALHTQQIAGQHAGPMAAAKVGQLVVQAKQESAKVNADVALTRANTWKANTDAQSAQFGLEQQKAQAEQFKQLGVPYGTDLKNLVHDANGSVGIAGSDEDKKGYLDETQAPQSVLEATAEIRRLRAAGVVPNQAALNVAKQKLQSALEKQSGGVLSQRNAELIDAAIGDPSQYFGVKPSANLDSTLGELETNSKKAISDSEKRHGIRFLNRPAPIQAKPGVLK